MSQTTWVAGSCTPSSRSRILWCHQNWSFQQGKVFLLETFGILLHWRDVDNVKNYSPRRGNALSSFVFNLHIIKIHVNDSFQIRHYIVNLFNITNGLGHCCVGIIKTSKVNKTLLLRHSLCKIGEGGFINVYSREPGWGQNKSWQ